jgi:site-specific DNA-methyltransferase (adenine-specific)
MQHPDNQVHQIHLGHRWQIYVGDSLAMLETWAREIARGGAEPFDGMIADPPYSSGGATRGDRVMNTLTKYVNSDSGSLDRVPDFEGDNRDQRSFVLWCSLWLNAAWRSCRPGATAHIFCDWRQLPSMTDAVQAGGWVWRGIVPWNKTEAARPVKGRHRAQCEYVIFCTKGPHRPHDGAPCLPGFYEGRPPQKRVHITQKPVKLIQEIAQLTPPCGTILDPFTGSGAHIEGIISEGRRAVGMELSPGIAQIAADRLAAYEAGSSLDDAERGQSTLFEAPDMTGDPASE